MDITIYTLIAIGMYAVGIIVGRHYNNWIDENE